MRRLQKRLASRTTRLPPPPISEPLDAAAAAAFADARAPDDYVRVSRGATLPPVARRSSWDELVGPGEEEDAGSRAELLQKLRECAEEFDKAGKAYRARSAREACRLVAEGRADDMNPGLWSIVAGERGESSGRRELNAAVEGGSEESALGAVS
jgi:hypothetical protein